MYEEYLRALLAPLGVYDLGEGTINGAELHALGEGLDGISRKLENVERESLTATAEGEGLTRRETLFARRNAAVTAEARRGSRNRGAAADRRRQFDACRHQQNHARMRPQSQGCGNGKRKAADHFP